MKNMSKRSEAGVALVMTLLALLILSAIAAALVYSTNTESQVNYNYRSEQVAYFGAKAGLEEARDRMMLGLAGNYYFANMTPNPMPTQVPSSSNQGILYILNEGNSVGSVKPWDTTASPNTNAYYDNELCHDGYSMGVSGTPPQPDVHCDPTTQTPSGTGWYQTTASQLPFNGSAAALAYKWVRISLKVGGSIQNYGVNGTSNTGNLVCWNGASEVVFTGVTSGNATTDCQNMTPSATPVYIITSLGISSTGGRKMVQADAAMNPTQPFPYGLYGTGTSCGDVTFGGNGVTDSFDSSKGTYATTQSNTGGDVGSNGNVLINGNNATIGGMLGVLPQPGQTKVVEGACPGSNYTTTATGNTGFATGSGNGVQALSAPITFTAPPPPSPAPQNNTYNPPTCPSGGGGGGGKGKGGGGGGSGSTTNYCMVAGTYGNISISSQSVLTLAPGVYNINTLSITGQASIAVSPPGQVVINIGGNINCPSPCSPVPNVVDMEGGSLNNTSAIANNFQINYGGNYGVTVAGGASSYMVVDAPNAPVSFVGDGNVYGAILGNTVNVPGNGHFHYDKAVKLAPPSYGALQMLSFRHIAY